MTQPITIAINGFGRIGRSVLRQVLAGEKRVRVTRINDIADPALCAHLLAYDSTFGPLGEKVSIKDGALCVGAISIPISQTPDPARLNLQDSDILMECTGRAKDADFAARSMQSGARRVLISGPAAHAPLHVLGVNADQIGAAKLVSNGSCTTNAIAPLLAALDAAHGIVSGHVTTVHCYTNSQPLVDAPRDDFARSRGGAQSMVPTTTSATDLVGDLLPALSGKVTGAALRVPVASVSSIDAVVRLERPIGVEKTLADLPAQNPIFGTTELPLVSTDLRARPESLIIALPETRIAGDQVRVMGWYDNEWGFAARMIDMAVMMAAG